MYYAEIKRRIVMKKAEYKKRIKSQISIDAEFITNFETSINILAEILEERDRVHAEYIAQGAQPVITFESDRGAKNPKQNPLLKQWNDLNTTALQYMRDLGITPAGLRKLQGQLPKNEKTGKLAAFSKLIDFDLDDDE